jgi:hypothetical protein
MHPLQFSNAVDDAVDVDANGHDVIALFAQNEFAGHVVQLMPDLYFPGLQMHLSLTLSASRGHVHAFVVQFTCIMLSCVQLQV